MRSLDNFALLASENHWGCLLKKLNHILQAQQFSRDLLQDLFTQARLLEQACALGSINHLPNRILATVFYEPSTRTRLSFEAAMIRLGGAVISTENAREFSSALKGESLEDSIRVIMNYGDVIVLRHYDEGAAQRAASVSQVPVINAGDGPGQHPTQALLDLYTIEQELGSIDGVSVAFVGDLAKGRTVRSLAYLLAKYRIRKLYFVAPATSQIGPDILQYLERRGIPYDQCSSLENILRDVEVVYQTRIQQERYTDPKRLAEIKEGCYQITQKTLEIMHPNTIIMHPFPRNNEIATDVDSDPRAAYFRQARNGLYIRMALLTFVLS